jgi:hypothetical protein
MTRWGTQRIESYEFLTDSSATACYVCDGANRFDRECCRHCGAPLAPAAESSGRQPRTIAVIGVPGAGKTTYLGMLADILSRQTGSFEFLARGAFSVSLQHASLHALARGRFPAQTDRDPRNWNWLHCEVRGQARRRPTDLIIPDVSGAALMEELDQPGSVTVIQSFLANCAGALLLVDVDRLQRGDMEPDVAAKNIVEYLIGLAPHRRKGWRKRPVAVVFTKADRCEDCLEDPLQFGRRAAPALLQQCQRRFTNFRLFATTSVGATLETRSGRELVQLPVRIEPRGTVQPFEWLIKQLAM